VSADASEALMPRPPGVQYLHYSIWQHRELGNNPDDITLCLTVQGLKKKFIKISWASNHTYSLIPESVLRGSFAIQQAKKTRKGANDRLTFLFLWPNCVCVASAGNFQF